jgi:hypothetical protein
MYLLLNHYLRVSNVYIWQSSIYHTKIREWKNWISSSDWWNT